MLRAAYQRSPEGCGVCEQSCCVLLTTESPASMWSLTWNIRSTAVLVEWVKSPPWYSVTLDYSISSYSSQISFSDPYFFLGPFCATFHKTLSYFCSLSVLSPASSCGFDACYLGAEVSLVYRFGPVLSQNTRWALSCPVAETHQQVLSAPWS